MKTIKTFHTDIEYYSKDDLKLSQNHEYSPELWKEILDYRKKYSFDIPLLIANNKNAHLTQTPWILQREIKMITQFSILQQSMLMNLSTKYSSSTLLGDIENKSFVSDIYWLINRNADNKIVSRSTVENIVVDNEEPISADEKKINKFYDNFIKINSKLTSPREIAKLFFNIKGLKDEEFDDIHTSLMETLKSDRISSILTKSASIIYAINSNKMFGDKSYEVTILSLHSLLKNSYKGVILKGLSFFNSFDYFKHEIEKSINEGEKNNGDLTYLTLSLISIIMYCVNISNEQIDSFIKNEVRYNSLTTRDKNKNVKQILKNYPRLSKKQTEFFVAHNDPRSSYSIKDFEKYIGSSYETARYSLDNLVEAGFYKKSKVGKKYVYKPIRQ